MYELSVDNTQPLGKHPHRRVSFATDPVAQVFEIPRINASDVVELFYQPDDFFRFKAKNYKKQARKAARRKAAQEATVNGPEKVALETSAAENSAKALKRKIKSEKKPSPSSKDVRNCAVAA